MVDSHGRVIRDLRISITDRCNFRCVYCMDPGARFLAREECLSAAEFVRVARVAVGLGVSKLRVTGGKPTLHAELGEIIAGLAGLRSIGPVEIALTTNGTLITEESARRWRAAGLDRVTVSIDAVDPARFAAVTRASWGPSDVIAGVRASQRAGLGPVKLNAVIVRGVNEDQVVPLAGLARDLGVEMRFIEFMPLDSGHTWDRRRVVTGDEVLALIDAEWGLVARGRDEPSATALMYEFADGAPGRIGLISPVSRPFCGACSRLRLTADGRVRPCLFSHEEWDLRSLLRSGADDAAIGGFLVDSTWSKQAGHGITLPGFTAPERSMSAIGG